MRSNFRKKIKGTIFFISDSGGTSRCGIIGECIEIPEEPEPFTIELENNFLAKAWRNESVQKLLSY